MAELKIHPAAELFRKLTPEEFEKLRDDIEANGQQMPIWTFRGAIIDGLHRYRACADLGVDLLANEYDGPDDDDSIIAFARRQNDLRRQQSFSQRVLSYGREYRLKRGREGRPKKNSLQNREYSGGTAKAMAKKYGIGRAYIERAATLLDHAPAQAKRIDADERFTISKAWQEYMKREAQIAAEAEGKKAKLPSSVKIKVGDFREVLTKWPEDSVDLIFTDPPYNREAIPLYGDLARLAVRVLKPGGSLIAYAGHYALPEIFPLMISERLRYFWLFASKQDGPSARFPGMGIMVEWKPLIWFTKGPRRDKKHIADFIRPVMPEKTLHPWEQSVTDAHYVIKFLTREKETVLDPMMGSGTTGVAAVLLHRDFVGAEIDKAFANRAKSRISRAAKEGM